METVLTRVLSDDTAGDPMRAEVRWTNLSVPEIVGRLTQARCAMGRRAVRRMLRRLGYRRRRLSKDRTMGNRPHRDEQFQNINRLKAEYLASGDPVVSIDTKKRELLGAFWRAGNIFATAPLEVFDHDFPSFASGVLIPHGVYDLAKNTGHLTLGTSHDTTEFACDSLRLWWKINGHANYPRARRLLILCDGGGSNSSSRHLWKQDLQQLADELGLEIRVAHYPPYCSKYNPIEHRLFPHVTRACAGVVFHTLEIAKKCMAQTTTSSGLSVTVQVLDRVYQIGRKVAADWKDKMRIVFDAFLPQWNYRAIPGG